MTDYPTRFWRAVGPDAAAGYERDVLGNWVLFGLVIYGPTTGKLRGTRLRDLEGRAGSALERALAFDQDHPPTLEQVATAWGTYHKVTGKSPAYVTSEEEILDATSPEALERQDGEQPDDFYRRIARAHELLSHATSKPTAELARRAGVPPGTAAAWVSRARARGLFDEEGEQQ